MILTCPNCNGQFKVDDALIGDKGRKVKCSSCAEVWFQESENMARDETVESAVEEGDESTAEENDVSVEEGNIAEDDEVALDEENFEIDLVDFDEPDLESETVAGLATGVDDKTGKDVEKNAAPETSHKEVSFDNIKRAVAMHAASSQSKSKPLGYGVAAGVFFIILTGLLGNSTAIMHTHPSMQAFYGLFGIHRSVPGKGLVFDRLNVEDNGETITVDGRILNLESETINVPMIEASLMGQGDVQITQWYIQPPGDILDGESEMSFHSVYYKGAGHGVQDEENHTPEQGEHATASHGVENHEITHGEDVLDDDVHEENMQYLQVHFSLLTKTGEEDDESNPAHHQDAQDHQSDHEESSKSHPPASSASHQEPSHGNH